jgi:hypothetical protein
MKAFAVAFAVTLLGVFGGLRARDAGRGGPASPPVRLAAGAAYIDSHVDVAHEGDALSYSIDAGLRWLVRHQYAEGMWSARCYTQMCDGRVCVGRGQDEYDVGVTALATLALLESGRVRPRYEDSARRALAWLAARQDPGGCVGPRIGKYMYGHSISTLAFARAYSIIGGAIYKHHAARGVRFLELARNPGLAWRYGIRDGENDTSVTSWAAAAILAASAPDVDVPVDPRALDGVRRWLDDVTGERYGEVSYARRGGGGASVKGLNDHYEPNECLTGMATWLRLRLGAHPEAPEVRGAIRRLGWNLPVWNADATSVDFTAWLAGARALAAAGDAELWAAWRGRLRRFLVEHQRHFNEGCAEGSWDPVDKWGAEGGRLYATATNVLTLAIVERTR